jgi:hypothetical protein
MCGEIGVRAGRDDPVSWNVPSVWLVATAVGERVVRVSRRATVVCGSRQVGPVENGRTVMIGQGFPTVIVSYLRYNLFGTRLCIVPLSFEPPPPVLIELS